MRRLTLRHLERGAFAAILILTSWGCATAPTPPFQVATVPTAPRQCPEAPSAAAIWTKHPDYRQVLISAHNQNNLPPPKLTLPNLRLYQDGNQLQIAFLQPEPITVGILVDNSGSMEPKLEQTRDALSDFIRDLNSGDEIFVDTFSDRPYTLAPLSTDHKIAIDHLGMMRAYGRTALYDVMIQGLKTVSEGCYKKKALLVLTDGMDNASTSGLNQVLDEARSRNVPIYSIGIGERADLTNNRMIGPMILGSRTNEKADTETLHKLAEDTGGETFLVAIGSQDNSLKRAANDIASTIGNDYIVGFVGGGSTSQLRFEVPNHNGVSLKIKSHLVNASNVAMTE